MASRAGEWTVRSLYELAAYTNGRPTKPSELCECGVPVIKIAELRGGISSSTDRVPEEAVADKHWVEDGDLLFAWSGSVGVYTYRGPRAALNQHIFRVEARDDVDQRFLRYLLQGQMRVFMGFVEDKKTTMGHVTVEDLKSTKVLVPGLNEQRAIAHILGVLDDKINLSRHMSATLEAIAQTLFTSWFVAFDPVRAKRKGHWEPGQTLPGFPGDLYDCFPDSLVESEMGGIPHGWKVAVLPEIIQVNPTRTLRKGEWAPYVDMANMPTRTHSPDRVIERPFGSGVRFMNGDTLLARITPSLENGKTAFVDFLNDGEIGWGSTEFIVLRPKPPFPEEYAYCLARSEGFRHFAIQSMTGSSGRQRVPPESLSHYRLAVAPRPIVEAFGRIARPLFERAKAATNESRTLAALRDALLPKLISGHLRVKDAERFLEERGL